MAEVKHTTPYPTDLSANTAPAPFVASASQSEWGAFRAFSASLSDDWSPTVSDSAPQWVQIKLDQPIRIWAVKIAVRTTVTAQDSGNLPYHFDILGSNDGETFVAIYANAQADKDLFVQYDPVNEAYLWDQPQYIELAAMASAYQYYRFRFYDCQSVNKYNQVVSTTVTAVKPTCIQLFQVEGADPASYTVSFVDWDGTVLKTEPVEVGGAATAPDTPSREGYLFIGWDTLFTNVQANLTVTAQYEPVEIVYHAVRFLDWDGAVLNTQQVADGESAVAPDSPIRAGFAFAGWDGDFSAVTADMTITACYAIDSAVFDYWEMLGSGHYPTAVHMMDNGFRIFYVNDSGIVKGLECFPALGLYDNLTWTERGRMSPDTTVSHVKLKKIAHHGAYGFWSAMGDHRFVMYMLPTDVSKYFVKGTLNITKDTAVSSASFTLQNVKQLLLTRNRSVLSPNAYISLHFSMGLSAETALGKWYIDKVTAKTPGGDVTVSARNGIGVYLKEQSFDEHTTWTEGGFTDSIKAILQYAGVEKYFVGDVFKDWQLQYEPDSTLLKGIEDLVKLFPFWKIGETLDGVIGVARYDDARFDQPSVYRFILNKTCWKYTTEYTDEQTYSRLCVYCKEPETRQYYDLPYHKLWPMPAHRTLFAKVPDGTDAATMQTYAQSLMDGISESGRTETFAGRFTPQMVIGDQIELQDGVDVEVIGTVTTVRHTLGKNGFYTEFTVDSGGRKGRLTLSDYVSQIGRGGTANCIIVEEPPEEETPVE